MKCSSRHDRPPPAAQEQALRYVAGRVAPVYPKPAVWSDDAFLKNVRVYVHVAFVLVRETGQVPPSPITPRICYMRRSGTLKKGGRGDEPFTGVRGAVFFDAARVR